MKRFYFCLVAILAIVAISCNKTSSVMPDVIDPELGETVLTQVEEPVFTSSHDVLLSQMAKLVNKVVRENGGMRSFIHSETLKRFDGDYEFLISDAMDKPVDRVITKTESESGQEAITFGTLLQSYLSETKSGISLLEELQAQYPDLQVAVPVHAQEWNPDTYIPVVVFEPEGYDDATTLVVPGYDAEGRYVELDATSVPDDPVIVISHNEGICYVPSLEPIIDPSPAFLLAPTNLTGAATDSGIVLSWEYGENCIGYQVWRKGQNDTQFINIANTLGQTNRGYQDTQVAVNATYQYYVIAYDRDAISMPSNYITVVGPDVVEPLASFMVIPSGIQLECEWTHGQVPYADVVIEHKGPDDANYSTLHRTTDWSTNYCFTPSDRGRRHNFRVYRDNGNSQSDALTDFIYPPYRNTNAASHVYLKKIEYPLGLEGWLRGDAEFDIVITSYDNATNTTHKDSLFLRTPTGEDISVLLKEWRCHDVERDWYSVISIHMIEKDSGSNMEMNLNVKKTTKDSNGIITEIAGVIRQIIRDEDDNCGSRDLYYYDNPEQVMPFPLEGVVVTISENS